MPVFIGQGNGYYSRFLAIRCFCITKGRFRLIKWQLESCDSLNSETVLCRIFCRNRAVKMPFLPWITCRVVLAYMCAWRARYKIKLENEQMLLDESWHAKWKSMWQRPELHLVNNFSPLYFFRPLLMCFRINGNFGKNKGNPAQIAKKTVRITKKIRKIKANLPYKAKNRIIKCKTAVSPTRWESSGWFWNGKVFKRRRYEALRNCKFYETRLCSKGWTISKSLLLESSTCSIL